MSRQTINLTEEVYQYMLSVSVKELPILEELRQVTAKLPGAAMQIAPEQGQLMSFLIKFLGAKRTLDIGTFTGYSALIAALAMPNEGQVISCDIDEKATEIAKQYWHKSGVEKKIKLCLGNAVQTLKSLIDKGYASCFDFIFIDADKNNYDQYYEQSLILIRSGGIIAIDNVLWGGKVADLSQTDAQTNSIRQLNEKILNDTRVIFSLIPIADGLTLITKK